MRDTAKQMHIVPVLHRWFLHPQQLDYQPSHPCSVLQLPVKETTAQPQTALVLKPKVLILFVLKEHSDVAELHRTVMSDYHSAKEPVFGTGYGNANNRNQFLTQDKKSNSQFLLVRKPVTLMVTSEITQFSHIHS